MPFLVSEISNTFVTSVVTRLTVSFDFAILIFIQLFVNGTIFIVGDGILDVPIANISVTFNIGHGKPCHYVESCAIIKTSFEYEN